MCQSRMKPICWTKPFGFIRSNVSLKVTRLLWPSAEVTKLTLFSSFIIGKELKNQFIIAFPVEVNAAKGHSAEGWSALCS